MFWNQEPEKAAGTCAWCLEPVLIGEDRYEFPDGDIVHDDCMLAYVKENFYRAGG